jgi:putative transposase
MPMSFSSTAADPIGSLHPKDRWNEVRRRAAIIGPLAARDRCPRYFVKAAAADLGLGERYVYALIARWRQAGGELAALLPRASDGGKGKSRIPRNTDAIIRGVIDDLSLYGRRTSGETVVREVLRRCKHARVSAPAPCTIRRRLKALSSTQIQRPQIQRRSEYEHSPCSRYPLDLVQVEDTKLELMLIDPVDGQPFGRPWLVLAIDVYSRCVAGISLALVTPSAATVGLCLAHVISEKRPWLNARGVESEWMVRGQPRRVSIENTARFRSQSLERSCAKHGIDIESRPSGLLNCTDVVESIVDSLFDLIRASSAATAPDEPRLEQPDSSTLPCVTLVELERFIAVAIARYNNLRSGIEKLSPLQIYEAGCLDLTASGRSIPMPKDPKAFRISFLPKTRRTLQASGITVDHITYYSHDLKSWTEKHGVQRLAVVHRDPNDLSRIYLPDETDTTFLEVPCRDARISRITLWEHGLALRRLRARKHIQINERSLFDAVCEIRSLARGSVHLTASGLADRRSVQIVPAGSAEFLKGDDLLRPFDDIEEW